MNNHVENDHPEKKYLHLKKSETCEKVTVNSANPKKHTNNQEYETKEKAQVNSENDKNESKVKELMKTNALDSEYGLCIDKTNEATSDIK